MLMLRGGGLYTVSKKSKTYFKGTDVQVQAISKAINTTGPTALIPFIVE